MEMTRRGLFGMMAGAVAGTAAGRSIAFGKLEPLPEGHVSFKAMYRGGVQAYRKPPTVMVITIDGRELARRVIKHMPGELALRGVGKL